MRTTTTPTIGIIGFGAFGRLMATHLAPRLPVLAHDPRLGRGAETGVDGVASGTLEAAASCSIVVLAMPVQRMAEAIATIAPHLRPGTLVLDVGSVKVLPAALMQAGLPRHVEIAATHPLFGPESARDGLAGLKIMLCPIRGTRVLRVGAFLRRVLRLRVILATPEEHDREAAMVQGLTHLIAKVLIRMEPLPGRMTTRSFELLMQGVGMVRNDAPEVFEAIERANPYAAEVRTRFFTLAAALRGELEAADWLRKVDPGPRAP